MNRFANILPLSKSVLVLLVATTLICGAQSDRNYTAAQAAQHVGENATVTDKVDGVHQSGKGNIFLNIGGHYPKQTFTAFIPSAEATNFQNFKDYEGKTVTVSGKIELYRGKPEIVVRSKTQIQEK
jgi:DNA/RNA endonuclease YhcR with UshA esterase domain